MSSVTLLPSTLQNCLQEIVDRTNKSSPPLASPPSASSNAANDSSSSSDPSLSPGIRAILLSTMEGVPLGRVYASTNPSSSQQQSSSQERPFLNEDVLASMESIWAPPAFSKQIPVLGLGKQLQQVTAIYDHGTLIHVYQIPVVVSILCSKDCNVGAIHSTAIPLLKQVLEPLCTTLVNSLKLEEEEDHDATPEGVDGFTDGP